MAEAAWKPLYTLGAVAALLAVAAGLLDVIISMAVGATLPEPGKGAAVEWFALLQSQGFLGLYVLGLLNLIYTTLMLPAVLALYGAFRRTHPGYVALALVLFVIGAALYLSRSPALSLLTLSRQYAAAAEPQRAVLATTGQMLLAQAEDFTPGSFLSFCFLEAGEIILALVMVHSKSFGSRTGWVGLLGFLILFAFTVWATFIPVFYDVAVWVGMLGGVLTMVWFVLVARRLLALGRGKESL